MTKKSRAKSMDADQIGTRQPELTYTRLLNSNSLIALEQRIVFDGAAAAQVAEATQPAPAAEPAHDAPEANDAAVLAWDVAAHIPVPADAQQAAPAATHEIAFVDTGVLDLQTLLKDIPSNVEIVLINSTKDGVDQIARTLMGRTGIDAIHILSHGSEANLYIGTSDLNVASMSSTYATDLAIIRSALSENADILLYGCETARGSDGQAFIDTLAAMTGADVAASADATGHATFGGDWTLEYDSGVIESAVVINDATQSEWVHLLAAPVITRTSSPIMYVDFGPAGTATDVTSAYASYTISSPAGSANINDLWVKIDNFAGGSVNLAANETNLVNLGSLAASNTKTAFFFLTASLATTTDQTHTISVYEGKPGAGGVLLSSGNFTLTDVSSTIEASANKVTSTVTGPTPAELGGLVTMTVTGATGVLGSTNVFSTSPATFSNWDPDAYELISSSIAFTGANTGTYTDQLEIVLPNGATSDYTATYIFRATETTTAPQIVSPVSEINSGGSNMKHTALNTISSLPTIVSPVNNLTLTETVDTSLFTSGGTATFTITLTNTGALSVTVDDIVDLLATSPGTTSYVAGSSKFGGVAISDPAISGSTLTWGNTSNFTVGAGSSVTLTYQALIPSTNGIYVNQAYAHVGATQIDTTLSTSDDSKASATVAVGTPPTAVDDSKSTLEDVTVSGNVLSNDLLGGSGGALTVTQFTVAGDVTVYLAGQNATIAGVGALRLNSDGSYTFTPAANYDGAVPIITYTISDGALPDVGTLSLSITPVNDAPVNTVPAAQTVNEDAALTITGLSVADVDGNLATTKLTVGNGTLNVSLAGGATISSGANGSATMTLGGTQAQINAALATLNYQGSLNFSGADVLSVVSTDSAGSPLSDTDTVAITVTGANDAPVLDLDTSAGGTGYTTTFTEKGAEIAIANVTGTSVTDIDNATVASATIVLTNAQASDLMTVGALPGGITSSIDTSVPGQITVTLTGSASLANYQSAIDAVRFSNNAANLNPSAVDRIVTVTVNDGTANSNTATTTIHFTTVNDPPTYVQIGAQTAKDGDVVALTTASSFTDPEGDTLTFSATGLPAGLSIGSTTGEITGTLGAAASQGGTGGVYSIVVTAFDGKGGSVAETFNYTVTNPAPVVVTTLANQGVNDGATFTLGTSANFHDGVLDTDTLNYSATGLPAGLSINSTTGVISGTIPANASQVGPYTVTVTASDGQGGTVASTFSITSSNQAPVLGTPIAAQAASDGGVVTLATAGAFSDPNGDTLTYSASGLPAGLSINATTGLITGTIDHSASQGGTGGVYSIVVTASDGKGGTVAETINFTVTNPAPVVVTPIANQGVNDGAAFSLNSRRTSRTAASMPTR